MWFLVQPCFGPTRNHYQANQTLNKLLFKFHDIILHHPYSGSYLNFTKIKEVYEKPKPLKIKYYVISNKCDKI